MHDETHHDHEPSNAVLLTHIQYIRRSVDELKKGQQQQGDEIAAAQGDIKVLKERTPALASGWGSLAGVIGGFFSGMLQGMFTR